jgi:hypothetical protein
MNPVCLNSSELRLPGLTPSDLCHTECNARQTELAGHKFGDTEGLHVTPRSEEIGVCMSSSELRGQCAWWSSVRSDIRWQTAIELGWDSDPV